MSPSAYPGSWQQVRAKRSSALLITLFVLSLMAIIVVAFLGTMTWEMQASARNYQNQQARGFATLGLQTAVTQLRYALGQWDYPYGKYDVNNNSNLRGFVRTPPTNFYSISPGILTCWSFTSVNAVTNYPLFSVPTDGTTTTVNLNAPEQDGSYPVLGNNTALNVYWVNVLSNPRASASSGNQLIGRYAFWMDDENAKININTADGSYNTNLPPAQCGLGWGTPTAVSLQELQQGGASLPTAAVSNIVAIARTAGFNSTREILRASGTTPDLYTNNVFNLTTMSRSPDFNIFGQPKIPLIPFSNPYTNTAGYIYNGATMQILKELFPSQYGYSVVAGATTSGVLTNTPMTDPYSTVTNNLANFSTTPYTSNYYLNVKWPLGFMLVGVPSGFTVNANQGDNGMWSVGKLIADDLAGTNATAALLGASKNITWPALPGYTSGTTSYLGKYNARQIDSIAIQILNFAGNDVALDWAGSGGLYTRSSDLAMRGWLSGQLVNGVGRNPKLDKVLMVFTPQAGAQPATAGQPGQPPTLSAALYLDLWFPSGFQGVSLFHNSTVSGGYRIGTYFQDNVMNCQDCGKLDWNTAGVSATNQLLANASALPQVAAYGGAAAGSPTPTPSYWGNNLLQTWWTNGGAGGIGGVDWEGNNPSYADADQTLAALHPSRASTNFTGYYGAGLGILRSGQVSFSPVFQMDSVVEQEFGPNNSGTAINEWQPGQYRCVANSTMMNYGSMMATNAAGGTLYVTGGIQYLAQCDGNRNTEAGAVPLEAMRGSAWNGTNVFNPASDESRTGEPFFGSPWPYTNVLNAVIPINAAIPISTNYPASSPALTPGTPVYVYGYVQDPLVNKFPADWNMTTSTGNNPAPSTMNLSITPNSSNNTICSMTMENTSTEGQLTDPNSYWLPTIDNNVTLSSSGTPEPPQIPRTSRFPSSGYLQYVRTGIMPDNGQNKGTPFRLLNFNSSSDSSQTVNSISYPDWAMLDLFYVPSSLLSYGSPYEAYAGRSAISIRSEPDTNHIDFPTLVTYSNTNVVNNMFLYGTYGGATSGRINPNGAVVYTTNVNLPTPGITRTVPLAALFYGITINPTITGSTMVGNNDYWTPSYSGGTTLVNGAETSVASAIASYLTTNNYGPGGNGPAPFRMPAEICNVLSGNQGAIKGTVVNPTRNDLVRQIVGNLTTQSNTFSVWVEAQSIQKSKLSSNYGTYDQLAGDQITSTVRYHFILERDLDPGIDGVYGNANNPGPDGMVGTLDDPEGGNVTIGGGSGTGASAFNSYFPSYVYRVIYAEEIR